MVVNPDTVIGGNAVTGTITIDRTAPSGGTIVTLSSDNNYAAVPSTVTIPQGSTSQTFSIQTGAVNTDLMVTITAALNTSSITANLTLRPVSADPAIVSISLDPESIIGGNNVTGTLTLDRTAPSGGTVVSLSSNKSESIVPATVTIPQGAASQTFTIQTTVVDAETAATISATLDSVTKTAILTVLPLGADPALASISLSPATITGGHSVIGTVILDWVAPSGGTVISLSTNKSDAIVPATVTIPQGNTSQTFTIQTSVVDSGNGSNHFRIAGKCDKNRVVNDTTPWRNFT